MLGKLPLNKTQKKGGGGVTQYTKAIYFHPVLVYILYGVLYTYISIPHASQWGPLMGPGRTI